MFGNNGLQTFLKFANLYGNPQEVSGGMPEQLPVGQPQPQMVNRAGPSISAPNAYSGQPEPAFNQQAMGNEPMSALEMFRQNVMNPPKRTQMTYPKSTLNGLDAALKIAAEPSPLAKNRVYVNGQAHQKQRVFTDPATGEQKFITDVKEPGFMEQVMRAMPASISAGVDILNQPHIDAVNDWEMKNKGLGAAATAESQMALAKQREANAGAIPERLRQGQERIDISRLTAQERVRLSQLNTLTDAEKLTMLQDGRMSLAEYQAAEAMKRVEAQQAGATERTGMQQEGATNRTGMQQAGATTRTGMQQTGANARNAATIAGAGERNDATIAGANARAGGAAQSPTQSKVALQRRAADFINKNPQLGQYIEHNEQGFPVIKAETPDDEYSLIYEHLYRPAAKDIPLPASGVPGGGAPAPVAPVAAPPSKAPAKGNLAPKQGQPTTGKVRVISPDGVTGTWDYSKGPLPANFKIIGQ